MPRAEDQSIPAVDLADYLKTFAPTTHDTNHYGKHPEQRDLVQTVRTFKPAATDDPSADQLAQQGIFKTCANGFKAMPANERSAYFQAAIGTGVYFFDFQMQRNMNKVIAGASYASLQRPDARRFDLSGGIHCAQILIEGASGAGGTFTWEIENEPTTAHACGHVMENYPQSFFLGKKWWNGSSWSYSYIYASNYNPAARKLWTGSYITTAQAGITWWMRFCRQGTEQVPCILWKFHLGTAQPNLVAQNFIA
jgi:hypothetical protein